MLENQKLPFLIYFYFQNCSLSKFENMQDIWNIETDWTITWNFCYYLNFSKTREQGLYCTLYTRYVHRSIHIVPLEKFLNQKLRKSQVWSNFARFEVDAIYIYIY